MTHFGFTKLLVDDLEATARFYKTVCGLTETGRVQAKIGDRPIDEIMFAPTAPGGSMLVLLKYVGAPKPTNDELILGFITDDVEAFAERAIANGGSIVAPIETQAEHGVKVGFIGDCEGHLLEVVEMIGAQG